MAEKPEVDMQKAAYVFASKRRLEVLLALYKRSITQKYLSRLLSISYPNLGRALKQMIERELVISESPTVVKRARYTLSEQGEKVMPYIEYLISIQNGGGLLEPEDMEVLVTVARYMLKVMCHDRYRENWHYELMDVERIARGEF